MLGDVINIMMIGHFILYSILGFLTLVGISMFIKWQVILLLKAANTHYNKLLEPLDAEGLNKELKPFGFAYNQEQDIFFSIMYPWQRKYGYCKSYDEISPLLSMIIDSEPIYFKYDNRDWLIEFWKGQYGMTTGGEIGIYVADETDSTSDVSTDERLYCSVTDDECLPMNYTLKKKSNILITRNRRHWWLTGFKLGEFSKPSELSMDVEITLKNKEMCDAFVASLKEIGYKDKQISVSDNTIFLTFNKPNSSQPFTKNFIISFIMQNYNKQNCKIFNAITKNYKNSLDKINFIRSQLPIMYSQIIDFRKSEHIFKTTYANYQKY